MTSRKATEREAYVWTWLAGATMPVVAGRLFAVGDEVQFIYGRSYRERENAIALYVPELPLQPKAIAPLGGLPIANAIRDVAPDAWGRRVILNRTFGMDRADRANIELDEISYLLESGSDRTGALDFQVSANDYVPRGSDPTDLGKLLLSADRVEKNIPLTPELDQALNHGSSIGGARPKAAFIDSGVKYIAKFSSNNDVYSVVKSEYIAMRLAALAGLDVAPVRLTSIGGKDILLVERFDRTHTGGGWTRKAMVSALTILELGEWEPQYASYQDLAEQIRIRFTHVTKTLHELFERMVFNILTGNLDDHARNHAAFWDGSKLTLTPAYDICPQARVGEEAGQAMRIHGTVNSSQLKECLAAAHHFHLEKADALAVMAAQVKTIGDNWRMVCAEAGLGEIDRRLFWGRQFLNAYAFYGLENDAGLSELAAGYRSSLM